MYSKSNSLPNIVLRMSWRHFRSTIFVYCQCSYNVHLLVVAACLQCNQQTGDDSTLKDQISVEEYLWRYIEKYHQQDLDRICRSGVKYTYRQSASTPLLVFESKNGSTVQEASERMTSLCQKLVANITKTTFVCPDGADRQAFMELGCGFAASAKAVFYIDDKGICHVIGPKDRVSFVKSEILHAWRNDQSAAVGQSTASTMSGYRMTTRGGISVQIYTGNLLQDDVDAVVNPANVQLSHGGGAAKAIADAAGYKLRRECQDYVQRYGQLKFTQVMDTSAGNMYPPVRFVIHAAGPPADEYQGNPAALRQAVLDTFFNCLRRANELHIASMSIPAISSGVQFHLP